MKEVTLNLFETKIPAQELYLNEETGKWEIVFTYTQIGDEPTYVLLGIKQKEYIEKRLETMKTDSLNTRFRLRLILSREKYTLADREFMNEFFNR